MLRAGRFLRQQQMPSGSPFGSVLDKPIALRVAVLSLTPKGGCVGQALTNLGFQCYNLEECLSRKNGRTHPQKWAAFLLGRANLDMSMLKEHDALCGLPASGKPERLLQELPGYTKVILVVETDKQRFADVYQRTVPPLLEAIEAVGKRSPSFRTVHAMTSTMYPTLGDRGEVLSPIEMVETFEDTVKTRVPPHRLLVYHPGDGWEPLLEFLEVRDRPEELAEMPFPEHDYGEEFLQNTTTRSRNANLYSAGLIYGVLAVLFAVAVPFAYNIYKDASEAENAMARVKKITATQLDRHVKPALESVSGAEGRAAYTQVVRTFGLDEHGNKIDAGADKKAPKE